MFESMFDRLIVNAKPLAWCVVRLAPEQALSLMVSREPSSLLLSLPSQLAQQC